MIKYNIAFQNPHKHFIDFKLKTSTNGEEKIYLQLPAWRPGRYELGNFSQNIYNWRAADNNGNLLRFKKINKDKWEVECKEIKEISISYSFYANQLDAGSCYLDEKQLYINPVHCIFYIPERIDEEYEIGGGEPASYEAGPYSVQDPWGFCDDNGAATAAGTAVIANGSSLDCSDSSDPVYRVVGVGSNGFPGYSPEFSGTYSRNSYAVYGEISGDASDAFSYQAALRYEDYDDFDSEVIGKVAGIYKISDAVAIRASLGTGFRAPTPGQQGTTNVSTRLPNGFPVATGLFPAGGSVAQALGASPLEPETSTQYTVGLVLSGERASITVDAYVINLDDRFNSVSTQDVSTDPTSGAAYANYQALEAAGVAGANSIGGVFWFTNAFDTSSTGVDVVATMPFDFDNSSGKLTASLNYNKTEFESEVTQFFSNEDKYDFVNNTPNTRWILTYNHYVGDLSLMGRLSYFGEADNQNGSGANPSFQVWDAVTFLDVEAAYQVTEQIKVMVGGRNITDEYPDKDELGDDCCGRLYDSGSTVDWQGAYYYGRVTFDF